MYLGNGGQLGKEPAKIEFDTQRQLIYNRLQAAYDGRDVNGYPATIQTMEGLLREHRALYDRLRPQIEASWIDPRFNDVQNFWGGIVTQFRGQVSATPTAAGPVAAVTPTATVFDSYGIPAITSSYGAGAPAPPAAPGGPVVSFYPSGGGNGAPAAAESAGGGLESFLPWILGAVGVGLLLRAR